MADDQHGEPGLEEFILQQFDGQDVEVVGRLVEQQQVRLFGEGLGEGGAADFTARQVHRRLLGVETEGGQPGLGGPALGPFGGGVVQQGLAGDDGFLGDIGEACAGLH